MKRRFRPGRLFQGEPAGIGRPFLSGESPGSEEGQTLASAVEEAILKGYNEGLERAQRELAGEVEAFRNEVQASLQKTASHEREFAAKNETRLLELVARTASRIARTRIEQDDEVVVRALKEALRALPDSTPVRARMHPEDVASLQTTHGAESSHVEFVPDQGITRGGVILESDFGCVDATLETAEQATHEAILGRSDSR